MDCAGWKGVYIIMSALLHVWSMYTNVCSVGKMAAIQLKPSVNACIFDIHCARSEKEVCVFLGGVF